MLDRISLGRRGQRPIATAPASAFNDVLAVGLGLALYVLMLMGGHRRLTGVVPLPLGCRGLSRDAADGEAADPPSQGEAQGRASHPETQRKSRPPRAGAQPISSGGP